MSEPKKEWYVVNTYAGHENRVKENLERRIETMGLQDFLFQIVVAEEKEIEYPGFSEIDRVPVRAQLSLSAQAACDLFAMTPYAWKTGAAGRARLQALDHLETEIGFDFLVFRRENTPAGERSDTV